MTIHPLTLYNIVMTIFYTLHDKLYVNITNLCSCDCIFCIRKGAEGVGNAESLWLPHEPDLEEVKAAFETCELSGITEIVFCGYGEPMEKAELVIGTCEYIKTKCPLPVRLNTNGLVRLINPGFDMEKLAVFDSISVSMNADDEEEYLRVTKPRFGAGAYQEMLNFAKDAKRYTDVAFTVVDVIGGERIRKCREKAAEMGLPLRIRYFIRDY